MAKKTTITPPSSPFWLLKSEPDVFSWEMCKARGKAGEPWTGVRNYQARNFMRVMKVGPQTATISMAGDKKTGSSTF